MYVRGTKKKKVQSITLIPDSVIPEFAHTGPRISVPQKQLTVCFVQFGIWIYRTLNLSPHQSGIRAIDCRLWNNGTINLARMNEDFKKLVSRQFQCRTCWDWAECGCSVAAETTSSLRRQPCCSSG